jgi:hypothetical protein
MGQGIESRISKLEEQKARSKVGGFQFAVKCKNESEEEFRLRTKDDSGYSLLISGIDHLCDECRKASGEPDAATRGAPRKHGPW